MLNELVTLVHQLKRHQRLRPRPPKIIRPELPLIAHPLHMPDSIVQRELDYGPKNVKNHRPHNNTAHLGKPRRIQIRINAIRHIL